MTARAIAERARGKLRLPPPDVQEDFIVIDVPLQREQQDSSKPGEASSSAAARRPRGELRGDVVVDRARSVKRAKSKTQQFIDQIDTYIRQWGGSYKDWYVGVTKDAEERRYHPRTDRNLSE